MRVCFALLVVCTLTATFAVAEDKRDAPTTQPIIEITDFHGTKHVVSQCVEDTGHEFTGTPFDCTKAAGLRSPESMHTVIAINFHLEIDENPTHDVPREMLLIPLCSIDDITFTKERVGDQMKVKSIVRLAGGTSFDAGKGYGHLGGKENLGVLGIGDFGASVEDGIKEIKCSAPVPVVGDFGFFGSAAVPPTALPFKVKITDTAGTRIVLEKALFCGDATQLGGHNVTILGDPPSQTTVVVFKSDLAVARSGTTGLSIASAKLSKMKIGKEDHVGGIDASVTFRSGEIIDLSIVAKGDGIIGFSAKGWVWIPWRAVSEAEFNDQ